MILVDVVSVLEEFFYQKMLTADVCGGRIYPVIAPSNTVTPFVTHDIHFAKADGPIAGSGMPTKYDIEWAVTTWIDGFDRQPLRPEWRKIFTALIGQMRHEFVSTVDGSEWDIVLYYGQPQTPPAVDSSQEGQWIRIMHTFVLMVNQRSDS